MRVPGFMNQGSKGPHVTLLQIFLIARGILNGAEVEFNEVYGPALGRGMAIIQAWGNLDQDGNCGPATRLFLNERFGFDFEAACLAIPGTTRFRQPEGHDIAWSRDGD